MVKIPRRCWLKTTSRPFGAKDGLFSSRRLCVSWRRPVPSVRTRKRSLYTKPLGYCWLIAVTIQPEGKGEEPCSVDPEAEDDASSANAMTSPSFAAMRRVWDLLVRKLQRLGLRWLG